MTILQLQAIDRDGGGNLSRQEIKYAFVDKLKLLTEKEAEALVAALDRNHDDVISWEEFRRSFYLIQVRLGDISFPRRLMEVEAA